MSQPQYVVTYQNPDFTASLPYGWHIVEDPMPMGSGAVISKPMPRWRAEECMKLLNDEFLARWDRTPQKRPNP